MTKHIERCTIDRFSGVYSRAELKEYFTSLNTKFCSIASLQQHPVLLTLEAGKAQKRYLTFFPEEQKWLVENGNKKILSIDATQADAGAKLANIVALEFGLKSNFLGHNHLLVLGSKINIALEDHKIYDHLLMQWKELKLYRLLHAVLRAKACYVDHTGNKWVGAAIKNGQISKVEELVKHMPTRLINLSAYVVCNLIELAWLAGVVGFAIGQIYPGVITCAVGFWISTILEDEVMKLTSKKLIYEAEKHFKHHRIPEKNEIIEMVKFIYDHKPADQLHPHSFPIKRKLLAKTAGTTTNVSSFFAGNRVTAAQPIAEAMKLRA